MRDTGFSIPNTCLKLTFLTLLGASLLAGCGIKGSLKTPAPVFGEGSKVEENRVPTDDLDTATSRNESDLLDDE